MESNFKITNPKKINATMAFTMTLEQWEKLYEQLASGWPACDMRSAIGDLVHQATKQFYHESTGGEDS